VKRKRRDSLDAYDLVLRALPRIYVVAMPEDAARALPFPESALALDTDYAGAHGFLAWCHQTLFTRAGFREENRAAAIYHARAALSYGRDDATPTSPLRRLASISCSSSQRAALCRANQGDTAVKGRHA
jgi:adenylate cyclase